MRERPSQLDNTSVRKLLAAAEAVFEERGFAGARVDAIAARAGMAKSHVYYHFSGKQQIFDDLVDARIAEILADKDALFAQLGDLSGLDPEAISTIVRRGVDELLVPRAAFLRIVLVESLGTGGQMDDDRPSLLMRVVGPLLDDVVARFTSLGYQNVDRDSFVSDVFHFGIVPTVVYVALGDRWAAAAGIAPARAHELVVSRLIDLQRLNVQQLTREQQPIGTEER